MKKTILIGTGLLRRSFKTLLGGAIIASVCMAVPAWASLIPTPLVCITDINGNIIVTPSDLDEVVLGNPAVITYGTGTGEISFDSTMVFFPNLGQRAVILTQSGGSTPDEIVILTINQLIGKNTVDVFYADTAFAGFAALAALWSGSPTVQETGGLQDVTSYLNPGEGLQICVGCGNQVPDSGNTLLLLGFTLVGMFMVYRLMPRPGLR
jgi:hypothetical protein